MKTLPRLTVVLAQKAALMLVVGTQLVGCATAQIELTPAAVNVRTIRHSDAGPEYIELETITVKVGDCLLTDGSRDAAMKKLRNRAAEMGGTVVRIEGIWSNRCNAWWITGTVYRPK